MPAHPSAKVLREERYAQRIMINGRLFSPIAPDHVHGKSMGHRGYGCRCEPCMAWDAQSRAATAERQLHNMKLLMDWKLPARIAEPIKIEKSVEPPKPVVRPTPKPRPLPVPDLVPPPLIPAIRDRVTSVALLEKITKAYFEPDWVAPADRKLSEGKERERRTYADVEIIVGEAGDVIWFTENREIGTGRPEMLDPVKRAVPKVKGTGGGSAGPRDMEALVAALKAAGCDVSRTGSGHIKVAKEGAVMILPSTASDWRSLRNSLADARRKGLL